MIDLNPACRQMAELIAGVVDGQRAKATPCREWSVADLVEHVDQAAQTFTCVARKIAIEVAVAGSDDRSGAAARSVEELGKAWDDPVAWQGNGNAAGLELSNERWGRIALTEVVVHCWDLARAIGQPFELPESTLRACLEHVHEFLPNAPIPQLWGPSVEVAGDAPLIDRIVAATGREPRDR
jgi:uncharacterized protein (TIGR03086 family)